MKDFEVPFVNPANIITIARIILTPFFLIALFGQSFQSLFLALIIFTVASLSDFFDGFIARRRALHTRFGEFADPLADKLLVGSAFVSFLFFPFLRISVWLVSLILLREIFVTILRVIAIRKGKEMKTEYSGKIKTFFQMMSVFMVLIVLVFGKWVFMKGLSVGSIYDAGFWVPLCGVRGALVLHHLPSVLVGVSAVLALISMVHYLVKNWSIIATSDLPGNAQ
jgi:CDP-diacylglycerol--glycerol-3-phosphate 3-phosphatidyltransferase